MSEQTAIQRTLKEYLDNCLVEECKWCGGALSQTVDCYDHSGGWLVTGFDSPQWLSRKCLKCGYEWSLSKLGVPRERQ